MQGLRLLRDRPVWWIEEMGFSGMEHVASPWAPRVLAKPARACA